MNASCNWVDLLQVSSVQFTCCEQATGVLIRLGLGTGTGKADVRGGGKCPRFTTLGAGVSLYTISGDSRLSFILL